MRPLVRHAFFLGALINDHEVMVLDRAKRSVGIVGQNSCRSDSGFCRAICRRVNRTVTITDRGPLASSFRGSMRSWMRQFDFRRGLQFPILRCLCVKNDDTKGADWRLNAHTAGVDTEQLIASHLGNPQASEDHKRQRHTESSFRVFHIKEQKRATDGSER